MFQVSSRLLVGVLALVLGLPSRAEEPSLADDGVSEEQMSRAEEPSLADDGVSEEWTHCSFDRPTSLELLSGDPVRYTPEAIAARVEGLAIARCTITQEGRVEHCRIIKSLPHLDEAIIRALESRRYRPVLWDGKPLRLSNFALNVWLKLP
ncbi:energy transducer TonB [Cystobacter fuscus]|uniref:energy transducer TonB n=1 Tax=Cystobacter fuscus TaxID=43 RepID=UPI002B2F9C2D|nr:TonB family protein [Cystobacter fuscus]